MSTRHLEKVRAIIREATELDISYAYDDLVFPDHSAFIIQFDGADPDNYFCFFQEEMIPAEKVKLTENLMQACERHNCRLSPKGSFRLEQRGEEVDIHFI